MLDSALKYHPICHSWRIPHKDPEARTACESRIAILNSTGILQAAEREYDSSTSSRSNRSQTRRSPPLPSAAEF